jgi:hypothetical protein
MPSSGYPIESFHGATDFPDHVNARVIEEFAKRAMDFGMFQEWLESFVGAYNYIRAARPNESTADVANLAAQAGIEEWDL